MASGRPVVPTARDGSPYPDRSLPTFERDLRSMFSYIARRYEWFNHISTLGGDLIWRPRALWDLDRFSPGGVETALDIGCGTGEFARAIAARYPNCRVVAADFTRAMVERAHDRARPSSGPARDGFVVADALRLPFADGTFDLVTNAFLARNLRDLGGGFRELRRVLTPGGVLVTLEVSEPTSAGFARFFHAYFDRVVPLLGRTVASEGPYRYLPESLKGFPDRRGVLDLLGRSGFGRRLARPQSGGIVTTFLAEATPSAPQSR